MKLIKYYEDIHTPHVNTLPDRAYFIPFADDPVGRLRETSERMQLLNGSWKFALYENPEKVPEGFYLPEYDPSELEYLDVPGCWQTQGYDSHQFTGAVHVIPATPPYVPFDNPAGTYVLDFNYEKNEELPITELVFEGVDSCFYVWMNGAFVGYSEVSHAISMFDVSAYIKPGKNRLAVLNLKWSTGTWFESQHKWRLTGIFRDVYLLKRPELRLQDYFIREEIADDYSEASIHTELKLSKAEGTLKVTVLSPEGDVVETAEKMAEETMLVSLHINNPELWNAELPKLYTMVIELPNERIAQRVGIRRISTEDGVLRVNGQPIRIKGVNRNDNNPLTGYTVNREHIERDLILMKQNNINAIRTAHFQNSPLVIELCNEYGLYVVSEADYEIHGIAFSGGTVAPTPPGEVPNYGGGGYRYYCPLINDDPDYEIAGLDRMKKNVIRDKNQPSVIMWSLGNESGWGRNQELAAKWIKEQDPSRLLHYENLFPGYGKTPDYSKLDILSRMYPSTFWLKEKYGELDDYHGEREFIPCSEADTEAYYKSFMAEHPFMLCEFSIAMGNGSGDLEDYFEIMERHERFCGGFVWEWADQAQYKGDDRNGNPMYQYGGDYGDIPNDGNFCLDGLNSPDRRPHTSLKECKNVIRPVRARWGKVNETVILKNMLNFQNLEDELEIRYEMTVNGEVRDAGNLEIPFCEAGRETEICVPISVPEEGFCYLRLIYCNKKEKSFMSAGFELGFDQLKICTASPAVNPWMKTETGKQELEVHETEYVAVISGCSSNGEFAYTYDKRRGVFRYLTVNGCQLLDGPMEFNISRAPTDSDRGVGDAPYMVYHQWKEIGYYNAQSRAYDCKISRDGGNVIITARIGMAAVSRTNVLMAETAWTISPDGSLSLDCDVRRQKEFVFLPRFGIRMFLRGDSKKVRYFGLGPNESYVDKKRSSYMHMFDTNVDELFEDYIMPQENGSHYNVYYLNVGEDNAHGIQVIPGKEPFSFNVSKYTQEMLEHAKHNYELLPSHSTIVCLDYRQSGIGSNVCGPALLEKYQLREEAFTFSIKLLPR